MSVNTENKTGDRSTLYLDSENSLVLPYFDTSSIANSNIDSITLSLFVLDIIGSSPGSLQITLNPVDLNTNRVGDGLSAFVRVVKSDYIDFRLPKELFEQTVRSQKRFLVHLVSKGPKVILKGTDGFGTTQDPRLTVKHGEMSGAETPDQPRLIENNYFNLKNTQLHFGTGHNVGQDIVVNRKAEDIPLWMKYLVALLSIFGVIWAVYTNLV